MIDLTDAFTCRPTRCSGRIIADLGCIDQQMAMNTCGLCRLMFTVRPQVNPQICTDTASYQLRAFSSTNIWLCENSGSCHKRFTTEWIDTVFLAVVRTDSTEIGDYPEEPMISRPGPCNNVLHSGFIGRVGSNCPYQARAISVRRPNNKIDFELVRSWIARCIGSHSGECQSATQGEIPYLRLINCVSRKIVSPSSEVSFVALSYVWGVISAFQVPEDGDNLIILERVVEDAIQVTISLGYTYLWVDRHCILQHDEHVKEVQLQNMNAVYANADITIVAVAGEDSSFGLPGAGKRTRISLPYMLAQGHLLSVIPPDPSREIRSSKWSTRGWTYQEGLLSRRRLFLTEYEVSYDCSKSLCRETIALPAHIEQRPHGVEQQLHESSWMFPNAHITLAPDSIIRLFDRLSEYTARQLSRESDVLNAMLGIFQVYGNLKYPIHHLCGVPIMPFFGFNWWNIEAGISYECFIDGLRWLLLKPASRRSGFPSWSWTGWRGVVASHWSCYEYLICKWDPTDELPLSLDEDEDEVFEEEVPWMELSIMEAGGPLRWEDYSRLSSTETLTRFHQCHTLEITAFTIEVSLRKGSACEWAAIICFGDEVMEGTFYQTKDASEDMQFDRNLQEERWLGIVLGNRLEHDKSMMTCVLVLQEYRQRRCWERIGLAKIRNSTLREEMCKRQTITLQ
ncbi:heterokaryon incompatibility protein-domain-containing protein [Dendryphion nanum]|uniref:Heterokaryon incompatibility protein-domain-containing protein n=1 Tax=Dendryphion nanum TaxID=256645 RepID=A0A9P9E227_9PLEO|nr:heterokaryon incompatibility protein-domain-containing protein [Dendryphion nanum]